MKYPRVSLIREYDVEEEISIIIKETDIISPSLGIRKDNTFEIRDSGNLYKMGLFLSIRYDWKIVTDSEGSLVLLKLNKGE